MRVVVCTKETPDTAAKVEVGGDGVVTWGDAPLVINPWDEYTVEEGILLKDRGASTVTVLSVGTEATREAIKHALAMGVDDAVLITDEAYSDADSLVISHALAKGIEKLGDVGLALFGKMTTDGNAGTLPAQVGRRLGWSTITYVSKIVDIDFDAKTIKAERLLEEGKQVVEASLPAVVSVVKDINEPRYPSFMGIRKAAKAEVPVWSSADIEADSAVVAKGKQTGISAPPERSGEVELIEADSPDAAAKALAEKLIEEKVV